MRIRWKLRRIVPLKLELKKIREETNRSSKAYEEYKARKEKQLNNNEYYQKYLEYIKINGCLIKNVPKEYITQELCELAVKQNGVALKWVPEELKTYELIGKKKGVDNYERIQSILYEE